ncbi:hypothetical protein Mapa_016642 [Marchantia paleacea]|nr:hypothetical protein Mapa_016642 [Marchantia paleacea]
MPWTANRRRNQRKPEPGVLRVCDAHLVQHVAVMRYRSTSLPSFSFLVPSLLMFELQRHSPSLPHSASVSGLASW